MKTTRFLAATTTVLAVLTLGAGGAQAAGKATTTTTSRHVTTTTKPAPSVVTVAQNAVNAAAHAKKPRVVTNSDIQAAANAAQVYVITQFLHSSKSYPNTVVYENVLSRTFTCVLFPPSVGAQPSTYNCPSSISRTNNKTKDQSVAAQDALVVAIRATAAAMSKHAVPNLADYQNVIDHPKGAVKSVAAGSKAGVVKFTVNLKDGANEMVCIYSPTRPGGSMSFYGANGQGPC